MVNAVRTVRAGIERRKRSGGAAAEQFLVLGAQLASGLGNFAFAVVMARVLDPPEFAVLRVFLALYLLLNVPAGSMSAGSALDPGVALRARGRAQRISVGLALAVAITAVPFGTLLKIPVPLVLALALSFPAIGSRALLRGRMWGTGRHRRGAVSLLVDVAVRLAAGTALGWMFGPLGGAVGVVAGGYASLLIVSERDALGHPVGGARGLTKPAERGAAWWTTGAFFVLALMFNQDLLLANRLLPEMEAARFAGISTVGGTAAFATMAIPWLLMPRAVRGETRALGVSLAIAALAGGASVGLVALWPTEVATLVLGSRYASIGPLLAPYMLAMAIFGIGRVLVAQHCASGKAKESLVLSAAFALVQAAAILFFARGPSGVVMSTLVSTSGLAASFAFVLARPRLTRLDLRARVRDLLAPLGRAHLLALCALLAVAMVLRLVLNRGLWIDEAIGVSTAQQDFPDMLETVRTSDVHPPLHYSIIWAAMRLLGRSEMDLRSTSIIAGILLVAVIYALGREFFDRKTAFLATVMAALSPLLIWYSQEARMYSVLMLFSAVAVWAQVRTTRSRWLGWSVLYVVATAAMLWSHYMALFQIIVQQAAYVAMIWRSRSKQDDGSRLLLRWTGSAIALVLLLAPLVPFALDQFEAIRDRQAAKVATKTPSQTQTSAPGEDLSAYALLANLVWALVGYHSDRTMNQLVALWPLGMVVALAVLGRGRLALGTRWLTAAAVVPVVALFALGHFSRNLFEVRYFATAIPLILLLCARVISKCASRPGSFTLVTLAVVCGLLFAGADQQMNRNNPRIYDFRGALAEIQTRSSSTKDVVLYEPRFLGHIVDYYAPDLRSRRAGVDGPIHKTDKRVFVFASFLKKPSVAARTGSLLAALEADHEFAGHFGHPQVRVWIFEPDDGSGKDDSGKKGRATRG